MPVKTILSYIRVIIKDGTAGRFLVSTSASMLLSVGGSIFFTEIVALPAQASVACALTLAFLFNFFFLRMYVFKSTAPKGKQIVHFAIASIAFRVTEYLLFLLLLQMAGLPYVWALLISLGISFIAKFVYQRQVVFR